MDWGGSGGTSSRTEWQVTTPHDRPVTEKPAATATRSGSSGTEGNELKVVLLGAPGVGKTSIIQKFVWGTFESSYYPTSKKENYYPSIILHDRNYALKVVDIPDIPFFPVNSFYSLSDLQAYGLRDASAYVLVFDLLCPDSFDYIAGLYAQIAESRDLGNIPVIVVGNKTDKVHKNLSTSRMRQIRKEREEEKKAREHHDDHFHHHGDGGFGGFGGGGHGGGHGDGSFDHDYDDHGAGGGFGGGGFGHGGHHGNGWGGGSHSKHGSSSKHSKHKDKRNKYASSSSSRYSTSSHWSSSSQWGGKGGHGSHDDDDHLMAGSTAICNWSTMGRESEDVLEKDISDKVTAEWKAIYRECSAQDGEAVTDVFKAVMEVFEREQGYGPTSDPYNYGRYGSDNDHEPPRRCAIL